MDELKWWSSLGVGGVLAGIIFYYSRIDRLRTEKQYTELASAYQATLGDAIKAVTTLTVLLQQFLRSSGRGRPPMDQDQ